MADRQTSDLAPASATASSNEEPLTLSEGIDALADLLGGDDPDEGSDPVAPGSRSTAKPAPQSNQKPSADVQSKDIPADELNFWDDDEQAEGADEAEGHDGSEAEAEEDEGEEGQAFTLSDDTEIDLGDGQKATLAALKADYGQVRKREADMQRHFTQSMQKVSEEREVVQREANRVVEYAQSLRQQKELIEAHSRRFMPQPPQKPQLPPQQDPVGWMEYQAEREQYDEYMRSLHSIRQAEQAEQERQQQAVLAETPKVLAKQRELLLARYPKLKNPELASRTMQDMVSHFTSHYGFQPQEVMAVNDVRFISAMLDAVAFHRIKARKPEARKAVENKPPVMRSGRRMNANDQRKWGDKAKMKRLAETGSLDAGAEALMDLI